LISKFNGFFKVTPDNGNTEGGTAFQSFTLASSSFVKAGARGPSGATGGGGGTGNDGFVGGTGDSGGAGDVATSGSMIFGIRETFPSDESSRSGSSVESLSHPKKRRKESKTVVFLNFTIFTL
jgi:hypothetical protein